VIDYLNSTTVDLLICRLELPDINGLELVASLKNCPEVIFVAESGIVALEAYNLGAVDVLVDVGFARFLKAVNKAWRLFATETAPSVEIQNQTTCVDGQMFVKSGSRIVRISCGDILAIEGYGDYIKIHTTTQGVVYSPWGIRVLESKLPSENFVRVHRSYIVAIDKIEEIEHKRIKIGQMRIPIGETFAKRFFEYIDI
jgi:DNA-binding LytR/AlgR family response regulator